MDSNYYWNTEEPHSDNNETMSEYLELQESFTYEQHLTIIHVDGTYAEGLDCKGNKWALHAGGNGDFNNHQIKFVLLEVVAK
tara:strand:- start:108 stop:353 length:246 start_codon:yes stop_codon:yes gene_type:complete